MTDEEIEKGLAHCGNGEALANCDGCPYFEEENCIDLHVDSLNYINRLKSEKEQIRKETAKEILTTLKEWCDRETPLKVDIQELAEKYGVEVDE